MADAAALLNRASAGAQRGSGGEQLLLTGAPGSEGFEGGLQFSPRSDPRVAEIGGNGHCISLRRPVHPARPQGGLRAPFDEGCTALAGLLARGCRACAPRHRPCLPACAVAPPGWAAWTGGFPPTVAGAASDLGGTPHRLPFSPARAGPTRYKDIFMSAMNQGRRAGLSLTGIGVAASRAADRSSISRRVTASAVGRVSISASVRPHPSHSPASGR